MAATSDSWMREYNEALRLSECISEMISERSLLDLKGSKAQRCASSIRRNINILATRLDRLKYLLAKSPEIPISKKEVNRREAMIEDLKWKAKPMAYAMDMSNFVNIDKLLGPGMKFDMSIVTGMDNKQIVGFQRQIMRKQDEALEKLEETVMSTKLIALSLNEELGLQKRVIDNLGCHVDVSKSGIKVIYALTLQCGFAQPRTTLS
ncbi:unnamed protein product [Cochlearia groenlandica]